ncbi:MAG: hypothetical protein K2L70_08430 [Clostridia bacterium]|nr:hypothetical protein [Clostridia bacterium]
MKSFKKQTEIPKPTWEEIVSMMYDEDLCCQEDYEIVQVIYSADKEHRYVISKSDTNRLTYEYQKLQVYDEEEMAYFPSGSLPAYWLPIENVAKPIFDDINILMRELKAEPQYKTFFD